MQHYVDVIKTIAAKPIKTIDLENPHNLEIVFQDDTRRFGKLDLPCRNFLVSLQDLTSVRILDPNDPRMDCAIDDDLKLFSFLGYESGQVWEFRNLTNDRFVIRFS